VVVLTTVLLLIVGLSAFFQVSHPKWLSKGDPYNERYMSNEDYDVALYMKYEAGGIPLAHGTFGNRVRYVAGLPTIDEVELYEPYVSSSKSSAIKARSWTDAKFWNDGMYYLDYDEIGGKRSNVVFTPLKKDEVSSGAANESIEAYDIEYCFFNNLRLEKDDNMPLFFKSVGELKYKIFDNGKGSVYLL